MIKTAQAKAITASNSQRLWLVLNGSVSTRMVGPAGRLAPPCRERLTAVLISVPTCLTSAGLELGSQSLDQQSNEQARSAAVIPSSLYDTIALEVGLRSLL